VSVFQERNGHGDGFEDISSPRAHAGWIAVREDTSDLSVVLSTLANSWNGGDDEYHLRELYVDGVFLDIGGHIGTVTVAVLLDNPNATAIIVEPLTENIELIEATIEKNGLGSRARVLQGAVGTDTVKVGINHNDRFIGNLSFAEYETRKVRKYTLRQLVKEAGGKVAALKTDCEGGEWGLLDSKLVDDIPYIFGEYHGDPGPPGLERMLGRTHTVTVKPVGVTGWFWAVPK
jgi:FkbM family methyltransferase